MFIQSCFIKKNTKDLREKLRSLGYNSEADDDRSYIKDDSNGNCLSVWSYDELFIENGDYVVVPYPFYTPINEIDIDDTLGEDCNTNEELFLAIAALRDDSDYMQWFVTEELQQWINQEEYIPIGSFELCFTDKRLPNSVKAHKATVKELIEHFK